MSNQASSRETLIRDIGIIAFLLLMAAIMLDLLWGQGGLGFQPTETPGRSPTPTRSATVTRTSTPTASFTRTLTPARTSTPTRTLTLTPSPEPVVLKIYLLDYTADTIAWLEGEINPAFTAAHPGVSVQMTQGSWSGSDKVIDGFFSTGQGPDLINLSSDMNVVYGPQLADMDPYLGVGAWPEIWHFGPSLENASYAGHLRGLPLFSEPRYVFCRTDLLAKNGRSASPQNFADWLKFAKQATVIDPSTNSIRQQALVAPQPFMAEWLTWLQVFYSLGGKLYKTDGSPNLDSPEALAATRFLLAMHQATYGPAVNQVNGLLPAQGSLLDSNDQTGQDNGAVCLLNGAAAAPAAGSLLWNTISVEPFYGDPATFPASRPVVLGFNDWLAVADYSPHKDLAADWLKLAFSREANNQWNQTLGLIPARNDSQYGYVSASTALQREAALANQYGVAYAGIYQPDKLQEIMQSALDQLINEQLTPEQMVAKVQADYTAALAK